jgi:hypothetical protein
MKNNPTSVTNPCAHVIDRLRTAEIIPEPYPHYYLENVLPEDYYRSLLAHLPESVVYRNLYAVTDLKLDNFRHRDQRDFDEGWTDLLPAELKSFWGDFHQWFLGPDLAQAVLHTFTGPLLERFGSPDSWPEISVESQLIRHRAGYFLGPHSDLYSKLVVILLYLAPDENCTHLGTSIFRHKDPDFACPQGTHYPFADFVKVKTVPYKPNSLLAFLRTDRSFHGVEPLSKQDVTGGNRDLIQYVLYDKEVRAEQLRARRMAAKQEAES